MKRVEGGAGNGRYEAVIPGQPDGNVVRYRIRARDNGGAERVAPSTNDLRTAWAFGVFSNTNSARVPLAFVRHGTGAAAELAGGRGRGPSFGGLDIDASLAED